MTNPLPKQYLISREIRDNICGALRIAQDNLPDDDSWFSSALEAMIALPEAPTLVTPAGRWREDGKSDPHGDYYDAERAALHGGQMTDDEVANAVYLNPGISNLTSAKERIRWLSRALVKATGPEPLLSKFDPAMVEALLENFKPPFRFDSRGGYVWDSADTMVCDDNLEGSPEVAMQLQRVRAWGHLCRQEEAAKIQDTLGEAIAEGLNMWFAKQSKGQT